MAQDTNYPRDRDRDSRPKTRPRSRYQKNLDPQYRSRSRFRDDTDIFRDSCEALTSPDSIVPEFLDALLMIWVLFFRRFQYQSFFGILITKSSFLLASTLVS